jgi:lysozyme family protein
VNFDEAFHHLLGHEGGYSNHPEDPGGETMWGVTKVVARENGYNGLMKDMPTEVAKSIYKAKYWEAVQAEKLPPTIRYAVFDAAVNSGPGTSIKWLQEAVGATPDGVLGPKTLAAINELHPDGILRRMLSKRLRAMTNMRGWPSFSAGWARRVATLLEA